jgi:hypothetical protein
VRTAIKVLEKILKTPNNAFERRRQEANTAQALCNERLIDAFNDFDAKISARDAEITSLKDENTVLKRRLSHE